MLYLTSMVRLQKQKAYVYQTESGAKIEHFKHMVNIPEDAIKKLGWTHGVELQPVIEGRKLILQPEGSQTPNKAVKFPTVTDITPKRKVRS